MAIESKYEFFLDILKTSLEALVAGDDSDLLVASGNAYADSPESKKIGYAIGDRSPNLAFRSADRSTYSEENTSQEFIIIVSEELSNSVDALEDVEKRLGYWMRKLDYLVRRLGVGQTFSEQISSVAINNVRIISTEPDSVLSFGIEEGMNNAPEIGIIYKCKFYYDQVNL